MFPLLGLLVFPHKKVFVIMLALLIWVSAWFTFLSQALSSITTYLDTQTIESLWGDIVIEWAKPLFLEKKREIEELFSWPFQQSSTVRFLNSLAIWTWQPLLTTILGYDEYYPLYGTLQTTTQKKNGVYLSDSLAQLVTGSTIAVGEALFPVDGTILKMPTAGIQLFDGWRFVLVPISEIERTWLVQTGSRIQYRYAYTFASSPDEDLVDTIQELLPEREVTSLSSARSQREQFFSQLQSVIVLALCSLIVLTYSGLRLINDILIRRLLETMRLVRILWTTKRRLIVTSLFVLAIVLLLACVLWWTLWYQAWRLLPWSDFLFIPLWNRWPYRASCLVTIGVMWSLAFSRQELFQKDNLLSTSIYTTSSTKQQVYSWGSVGVVMLLSLLVELWRSRSSLFLWWTLVSVIIILYFFSTRILRSLATYTLHLRETNRPRWRVIRRSSQPWSPMPLMLTIMTSILTISWSCFLFWQGITEYINDFQSTQQANTFILNLREQDTPRLEQLFPQSVLYDVILWRIISINEVPLGDILARKQLRTWSYTREFNMTTVAQDDEVVAWKKQWSVLQEGEISVDSRVAESLDIEVGDQIVMSIVWREFAFSVVQLRRTTRNAIKPFFFFVLPNEQFVNAPKSYFSLQSFAPAERPMILKSMSETIWTHLSYIEVDEVIAQVEQLLQAVAWAIVLVLSSVLTCWWVLLLLCFRNLTKEHWHDMELLSILGVANSFISETFRNVSLYPRMVSRCVSIVLLCFVFLALLLFQDAIPFFIYTLTTTILYISAVAVGWILIIYFLTHKYKNK